MQDLTNSQDRARIAKQFERGREFRYRKGEVILRAGDTPSGVYLIRDGFVKVYAITDEGTENLHIMYKPGELFPLIWVLLGAVREVFYQAAGDVALSRLPREEFVQAMQADAGLAVAVARQLAVQFDIHADRVENLEYNNAYQRVVYRLVALARRFGRREGQGVVIAAPLTHQDIADSVNLARETASREIDRLGRKGLVDHRQHQIFLPDVAKLAAELGDAIDLGAWGLD